MLPIGASHAWFRILLYSPVADTAARRSSTIEQPGRRTGWPSPGPKAEYPVSLERAKAASMVRCQQERHFAYFAAFAGASMFNDGVSETSSSRSARYSRHNKRVLSATVAVHEFSRHLSCRGGTAEEIGEGLRQCLWPPRRVGRTAAVGMVSLTDLEFRDRGDERRHGLGRVMIEVPGSCPRSAMGALPGTSETEMALARRKCNSVRLRT